MSISDLLGGMNQAAICINQFPFAFSSYEHMLCVIFLLLFHHSAAWQYSRSS